MAGTGLSLGTVARRILHLLCAGLAPRRPRVLLYHGVDASRSPIAIARETFAALKAKRFKLQINQRYALAAAAQAHRDLEARKTTGATVLIPA